MPSPDLLEADRLEALLRGAPPEGVREALVVGLVRELRSDTTRAPESVRRRVRELNEPAPARRPSLSRRRAVLAVGLVALVALVGAGLVANLGGDGSDQGADRQGARTPATVPTLAEPTPSSGGGDSAESDVAGEATADSSRRETLQSPLSTSTAPLPSDGRARDVDMTIELRLRDADRLSEAAGQAMGLTNDLGGNVRSSSVETAGRDGIARLELRVPVRRAEDALRRLSGLGTITGQQVAIRDLQAAIDRRADRIESLRRAIKIDRLRLASGTLDPEERLRIQIRLERERALLGRLERERGRLAGEAAYAEISLVLHTREAAGRAEEEGGIAGAARTGLELLVSAGSIAVLLMVVATPLLLLGLLLWLALRARARRVERSLLEHPRPAEAPRP